MKNKALLIVLLNITEKYLEIDNYRFEGKLKFTPGSEVKLTGDESVYAWFNVPHNARVLKITAFPIEENVEKDPVVEKVEKVELKEGENSSGSDNVPDIDILSALGENTLPEQEELNPEQEDTNEQEEELNPEQEEVEEEVKKVTTKKTTKNVLKSKK